MTRDEITEKVNGYMTGEFEIEEGLLKPEADLKKDLGIDSLDLVDIVVMLDKFFGIKLKTDDLKSLTTLDSLYDFIEQRMSC